MKLFIQLIILNEYRKKLKLDWVGSSFIGQVAHLSNYIEIPNVEILALAELENLHFIENIWKHIVD